MFSKTLFLDITIPYNLFISENISTFYKWKAKTTSQNKSANIDSYRSRGVLTEVNIYVNVWTKFPLDNRQPPKALLFNRQPSKLEKINRQPS